METWEDVRQAYLEAGVWFVDVAARVGDRWEQPALGEWDVRALVGHTSRAFLTVETYLTQPASSVAVPTAAEYFRAARALAGGADVAQRGRAAGTALGSSPSEAVAEIAERVRALVLGCDGEELLTTLVGGMRLIDYLPTRTFELSVHTADLASALDEPLDVPALPAAASLRLVEELALADGRAGELLLAATGRSGSAFSAL